MQYNNLTSSCCSASFEPLRVAVHPFSPAKALSASPDWMQASRLEILQSHSKSLLRKWYCLESCGMLPRSEPNVHTNK